MAFILHPPIPSSSSSFTTVKPYLLLHPKLARISVKSQQGSSTEQPTSGSGPSAKKPDAPSPAGLGFGSSSAAPAKSKQPKGKRERASIIRREPFEKPGLATPKQAARADEPRQNERAFVVAWLGLGAAIILEGIALAASGFLPEAWDKLLVKYLYPSFTPTIFLFVAGSVAYGVIKYLQNEKSNTES